MSREVPNALPAVSMSCGCGFIFDGDARIQVVFCVSHPSGYVMTPPVLPSRSSG